MKFDDTPLDDTPVNKKCHECGNLCSDRYWDGDYSCLKCMVKNHPPHFTLESLDGSQSYLAELFSAKKDLEDGKIYDLAELGFDDWLVTCKSQHKPPQKKLRAVLNRYWQEKAEKIAEIEADKILRGKL